MSIDIQGASKECESLLTQFNEQIAEVSKIAQNLKDKKEKGTFDNFSGGVKYLDVKVHLMLSYCIKIVFYMMLKVDGVEIEGNEIVDSLVYVRTLLEKLQPLDKKLKYQLDKLIQTATSGLTNTADPMRFKPNPNALVGSKSTTTSTEDGEEEAKTGAYVPPRISAVFYDDETAKEKEKKKEQKRQEKMRESSIFKEMRDEFSEAPVEVKDWSRILDSELRDETKQMERLRYEEDNYTRLPESKKERNQKRSNKFRNDMDDLADFGNFSSLAKRSKNQKEEEELGYLKKKSLLKKFYEDEKAKGSKNESAPNSTQKMRAFGDRKGQGNNRRSHGNDNRRSQGGDNRKKRN